MNVSAMHYQFHNIDATGEESGYSERYCINDISAIMHARRHLGNDYLIEIWQGTRAVGHVGRAFGHWFLAEGIASPSEDGVVAYAETTNRSLG